MEMVDQDRVGMIAGEGGERHPGRYHRHPATESITTIFTNPVTTRYGLLHYANLIRRTGPYCFLSTYLI
jgi:hypothetical protein